MGTISKQKSKTTFLHENNGFGFLKWENYLLKS